MPLSNHQLTFFLVAFSDKLQTSVCLSASISASLPFCKPCLFTAIFFGYKSYMQWNIPIFFFPVILNFNWSMVDFKCCIQFSSVTQSWPTLWDSVNRSMAGLPVHYHLLEFTQIHVQWVGDAMQPSHLLLSPSPPDLNLCQHQCLYKQVALCIRWPKCWSFSCHISPSNENSGLISLRMDWLDLLAVQGTLKNLLQHHGSKASILQCSAFFIVQISHPYMTTGKTIALTRWTFVGKVMSAF